MRQITLLMALALCVAACNSSPKQNKIVDVKIEKNDLANKEMSYDVDSLMVVADSFINKTVSVHGYVTHTCKHAGKRCFIVGESQKNSMRVEAKEGIGGFNRELVGSEIAVQGILRERRLSQKEIAESEAALNKKAKEDGSAESCHAELNNIAKMRQWMKERGKNYYAIYYLDGNAYEVLD
jgi:hypothetical protein